MMTKAVFYKAVVIALLFFIIENIQSQNTDYTKFVKPFIGTGAKPNSLSGSVFPGPCMPFGFVQLSPDTYSDPEEPASAYSYEKNKIYGFSHTHLSGTGVGDLYDILLMPTTGMIKTEPGNDTVPLGGYSSVYAHNDETAFPGYYSVLLKDYGIKAELTATEHVGVHRYTFPESENSHIIIDLNHTLNKQRAYWVCKVILASLKVVDNSTIEGYRIITGWSRLRKVYFVANFSKPFKSVEFYNGKKNYGNIALINGTNVRAVLNFNTTKNEQIIIKLGLSSVDMDGAYKNLQSEMKDWNFEEIVKKAREAWNKELGVIDIEAPDKIKEIFYTALYHNFIQPNNIADVDGRYIAPDYTVKTAPSGKYYSTFSLWDTYRATHPLYALIKPNKNVEFINSMLLQQAVFGYLPIWHLWGDENYCMIGNHAIPVIADAMLKDINGFDYETAYNACKASSEISHQNSPWDIVNKYKFIPEDIQTQSVSLTLELAYDDWCMAQMAKKLGKKSDYDFFSERAAYFKNLYDPISGFFRAKDKTGKWMEPFNPLQYGGNGGFPFTEGNAWQYFWYVPHDVKALIDLVGGDKKFIEKLDSFFVLKDLPGEVNNNASGFIGQYAHGNEPSHHIAYLYNWTSQSWKAQYYCSKVLNELYDNTVYGLCGNEDCGQMSAWYVFSAMGFYPVNPANGIYAFGSPMIPKTVLHLYNKKDFTIITKNAGNGNIYIKTVKLNGKPYYKNFITYQDIISGSTLEFVMDKNPNKVRGTEKNELLIGILN
jgi:predicted alpha-1,2-mannosidase